MKIIFFGPPGSGKGTYATILSDKMKIPHISTGDMFRDAMAKGTPLGKRIKDGMDKGILVDDATTNELVKERLKTCKKGYILDGYPRTMTQGKFLEKLSKTDVVINLLLDEDIIIEKTLGRRICKKCREIYNVTHIKRDGLDMPALLPKKSGVCDKCGGQLTQRADDNEKTIKGRIKIYHKESEPLLKYYGGKGIVKDVEVVGAPDVMVKIILGKIKSK